MLSKPTNIQEIYENLIKNNKKIILFGAGRHALFCINRINDYIWYLCDDWKTPEYISKNAEYPYSYTPIEELIDCIIDNDARKQQEGVCLNGCTFRVEAVEYLERIDSKEYILIIVTNRYETEVKEQLQNIENIKDMPCYSYASNMHYYKEYSRGLVVDRIILPYMISIEGINYREVPDDEYDKIKSLIEQGEYVSNGIAFQITTICNLRCKYCADYVPSMRTPREMDVNQVLKDIDTFFSITSRCLYVQLSTAEAVLCSNLDVILEKLLSLEAVQRIELVTNGLSYPKDEKTLKLLSDPKIIISMSNYNMPEKTVISRKFYKDHNINVRFLENQNWTIQGRKPYRRNMSHEELCNRYLLCDMALACPHQIIEGHMSSCGKIQRYLEISDLDSTHDSINLSKYETKDELKQALIKLQLEPYMDGCAWCDVPWLKEPPIDIQSGEQITT